VGLLSLLQAVLGHRLPLIEGVAGLWWSVYILMAQNAIGSGRDALSVLPELEGGLMVSGLFLLVICMTPAFRLIRRLFTPLVIGIYLMLLSIQMSGTLIPGMTGTTEGSLDERILIVALVTVSITLWMSYKGKGLMKSFSALGGIVSGWLVHTLLGLRGSGAVGRGMEGLIHIPRILAWGPPRLDGGILLTSIISSLILLSNLYASLEIMKPLQKKEMLSPIDRRGGMVNGLSNILSGLFSGIGTIPFTIAVSFIHITGSAARLPYIIACLLMIVSGFLNPIGSFFTSIPLVVGQGIAFVVFAQTLSFGIQNIQKAGLTEENMLITAMSVCTGVGIMFLSSQVFQGIHPAIRSLVSNGMLMGTLVALLLEQLVFSGRKKREHSVDKTEFSNMDNPGKMV
jgi:xanthine/uracil permease